MTVVESHTRAPGRRRRRLLGWWLFAGAAILGIGASFALQVYEAFQPVAGGLDRTRWRLRESLAPPRTDALVSLDWTLVDLAPPGDVPGTGARHPRRNEDHAEIPRTDPRYEVLLGGASSVFATRIVERMLPGVTYELSVRVAPEGAGDPDARIYLARDIQRPDASVIPIAVHPVARRWSPERASHHEFARARLRYTATPADASSPLFAHIESRAAHPEAAVSWDVAQVLAYPPADSQRVRDLRLETIWERGVEDLASGAILALVAAAPLAQLITLVLLLRTRRRDALPDGLGIRLLLVLGLAVAPIQELLAWTLFSVEEWQGQRGPGYWRYVWTSTRALVWLPWGLAASLLVAAAALVGPRWRRARLVAGVLAARATVAATFVIAALVLQRDSVIFRSDLPFLFVFPAAAAANDLLYARQLVARVAADSTGTIGSRAWLLGWLVSVASQLLLARGTYGRLPSEWPAGDCFVVTAAAQGHPRFVGSRIAPGGRRVNAQLETLRQLETRIRAAAPRFHRRLRAIYDRVGPIAAGWIGGPWRADLAYLALKPLEWLARAERMISRGARRRERASRGDGPHGHPAPGRQPKG
jgi:hypothetical protein